MHFTVHVAVPADTEAGAPLYEAVERQLKPFFNDQWDWFVIGGRWGGYWVAKHESPGIGHETMPSSFGMAQVPDDGRRRADALRVQDIEPESMRPPHAMVVDHGGEKTWVACETWNSANKSFDVKPTDEWDKEYLAWVQSLPADTWLVNLDCHE